jgi:hypothetical protein
MMSASEAYQNSVNNDPMMVKISKEIKKASDAGKFMVEIDMREYFDTKEGSQSYVKHLHKLGYETELGYKFSRDDNLLKISWR